MTLSLFDATAWLVANGIKKADGRPRTTRDGIVSPDDAEILIYESQDCSYWTFTEWPVDGIAFINITPEPEPLDPTVPHDASFSDMSLSLRAEDGVIVEASLGECWSGTTFAIAARPPQSCDDIQKLLDVGRVLFKLLAAQLDSGKPGVPLTKQLEALAQMLLIPQDWLGVYVEPDSEEEGGNDT